MALGGEKNLNFNKATNKKTAQMSFSHSREHVVKSAMTSKALILNESSKALDPEDPGDAVSANYTYICIIVLPISLDCFVLI